MVVGNFNGLNTIESFNFADEPHTFLSNLSYFSYLMSTFLVSTMICCFQ